MTDSTSNKLFRQIKECIHAAWNTDSNVLLSWTEEIQVADPVLFYKNSQQSFEGSRFYWSSPKGLVIIGSGEAVRLEASGLQRVDQMIQLSNAVFKDAAKSPTDLEGTGALFFNGYSFQPEISAKDSLWNDFRPTEAIMPEWMITFHPIHKKWVLTFNHRLRPEDDAEQVFKHYEAKKAELLAFDNHFLEPQSNIKSSHENDLNKWLEGVKEAICNIKKDKIEKVVLSRTLTLESDNPFNVSTIIKALQPYKKESYLFVIERGKSTFLGASPERLIRKSHHSFSTMCLAGTIKRGNNKQEDEEFAQLLLQDAKNLSEHQMVVKIITEVMKAVCGKVSFPLKPSILKTKSVQHLYTPVEAIESEPHHILELVKMLHPTPAMGGVPLNRAIEEIAERESYERGWYASPIGWFDQQGDGEFIVGIRSALIKKNNATLFAGCGIVRDSDPLSEQEETRMKFRPMRQAIGGE